MKTYTPPLEKLSWADFKQRWNASRHRRPEQLQPGQLAALQIAFDAVRGVFDDPPAPTRLVLKSEGREAKGLQRPIAEGDQTPIQTPADVAAALLLFLEEIGGEGAPEPLAAYFAMRSILEWDGAQSAIDRGEAAGAAVSGFSAGLLLGLALLHEHAPAAAGRYKSQDRDLYAITPEDAARIAKLATQTRRALVAGGTPYKTACALVYDRVLPELAALTGKSLVRETDRDALKKLMQRAEEKHAKDIGTFGETSQ